MITIVTTTQSRAVVATLDEALALVRSEVAKIDPWLGATVALTPVERDSQTQTYMWEVLVTSLPENVTRT
jgi:hypothetical protein